MAETAPRFTKDDFLNARDLVKKLNNEYDIQKIKSIMAAEFKRGTKLINSPVKRELIIKPKTTHHKDSFLLHPLGYDQFAEILKQKGK